MSEAQALLAIALAMVVGAMSPGPSFIVVARMAVGISRAHAVMAAFGMGLGGVVFASAALLGLQALLTLVPTLYTLLRILGGLYLIWIAYRIWQGASEPLKAGEGGEGTSRSLGKSLAVGFITQVSNPKTAIVYASIFAAFLPGAFSAGLALGIVVTVFLIESGWYAFVAVGLSAKAPRAFYLRFKAVIDSCAALVLGGLGGKLVLDAVRDSAR